MGFNSGFKGLSTVLPYFSSWSCTCHEDLPSNRHRQYCVRNHDFGSAGGVRRDATSLCMPLRPSGPVYVVMLCQSVLILQFWFPQYSPPSLVTPVINCGFLHPLCLLKAVAWCMQWYPRQQQLQVTKDFQVIHNNVLTGTRVCWISLLYIK